MNRYNCVHGRPAVKCLTCSVGPVNPRAEKERNRTVDAEGQLVVTCRALLELTHRFNLLLDTSSTLVVAVGMAGHGERTCYRSDACDAAKEAHGVCWMHDDDPCPQCNCYDDNVREALQSLRSLMVKP